MSILAVVVAVAVTARGALGLSQLDTFLTVPISNFSACSAEVKRADLVYTVGNPRVPDLKGCRGGEHEISEVLPSALALAQGKPVAQALILEFTEKARGGILWYMDRVGQDSSATKIQAAAIEYDLNVLSVKIRDALR